MKRAMISMRRVAVNLSIAAGIFPLHAKAHSLPPSGFPELPSSVAGELDRRACRIPQKERRKRGNVIQGEFLKPGKMDWAILCTTKEATSLLVFEIGSEQAPTEIERRGSAERWSIMPVNEQTLAEYLSAWKRSIARPKLDHQGISSGIGPRDPTSGRFSDAAAEGTIFYFDGKAWTKLVTVSVN